MADDAGDIQTEAARAAPSPHNNVADPSKTHGNVVEHARAAAAKEQDMTLLEGIRLYPKAIAFSIIISTCIVMEGYDVSLINNFCV
jgi:MFS transporter, SP family, general alpha glucoside:H+ symporter